MKNYVSHNRTAAVSEKQNNPTLRNVAAVYGGGVVTDWLVLQLTQTFALCGFDFQLGAARTVQIVADKIASEYDHLRLGELALFFHDFEQGAFGDFATRYDNQRFFNALKQFQLVRAGLRERLAQEAKERERAEWAQRAVPCPDELLTARKHASTLSERG